MKDGQGRLIDYLRISVTDRCNNRCVYCMPEEGLEVLENAKLLTYEELLKVCRVAATLGVHKIKLTGGEPLIRKDLAVFIKALKKIEGIEKVTLTTNGVLLKAQLQGLVEAGLDGVNISLDTLDAAMYKEITKRNDLEKVLEGIEAASGYPQLNVKVNCVPVTKRREDLRQLVGLAKEKFIHVRFIEMMPIGYGKDLQAFSEEAIQQCIEEAYGCLTPYEGKLGEGPCRYYCIDGFKGKIGFISAISHKFCANCNRIRLTADGYLKTCLQYEAGCDLKGALRQEEDVAALEKLMKEAIGMKPTSHHFYEKKQGKEEHRSMSQIGG
ncbi:MAG: GTP 3',8-cyclase MoaA [Cellulosilyticaceae bacterium]